MDSHALLDGLRNAGIGLFILSAFSPYIYYSYRNKCHPFGLSWNKPSWHIPKYFIFLAYFTAGLLVFWITLAMHGWHVKDIAAKDEAKEEYKKYLRERDLFFAEYEVMQKSMSSNKKLSGDERDDSFFRVFPDAKLYLAPRNADDFEFIAESWMKYWGIEDAQKTPKGSDGGIDVYSSSFVAQVKFFANRKVERPDVQNLYGVAQSMNAGSIFFSYASGYTTEALEWAEEQGMACFSFDEIPNRKRFEFIALTTSATKLVHRYTGIDYSVEQKAEEYRMQDFTEDSFYIYPKESWRLVAVGFRDFLSKVNIFHRH